METNETSQEKILLHIKWIEKISDPSKTKEYYQSYLKRKNTKLVKLSKTITQQPKPLENPNFVDRK